MKPSLMPAKPSFTSLVEGLLFDCRTLISQEFNLALRELLQHLKTIGSAALSVSIGLGLSVIGCMLLVVMLVHLLEAVTHWPLWLCYGLIGGLSIAAGLGLFFKAKQSASEIRVVPQQTVQTLKESTHG
ncbi:MAG: phage holin family protein [Nitrospiraceae bacterium]